MSTPDMGHSCQETDGDNRDICGPLMKGEFYSMGPTYPFHDKGNNPV